MLKERQSAEKWPYVVAQRKQLVLNKTLIEKEGVLAFTVDVEFSSPSAAAVVIHGGNANGLTAWRDEHGKTLKQIDEEA